MGFYFRCGPPDWYNAMTQKTLDVLARVREMGRVRYANIQAIRKINTVTAGRIAMPLDESTKAYKIAKINRLYRQNAKAAYDALNLQRLEAGLPKLENPFEKGTTT